MDGLITQICSGIIGTGSSTQKSEPMYLSPMIQNTIRKIIEKED